MLRRHWKTFTNLFLGMGCLGWIGVVCLVEAAAFGWHVLSARRQNVAWNEGVQWVSHTRGGSVLEQYTLSTLALDTFLWLAGGVIALLAWWFLSNRAAIAQGASLMPAVQDRRPSAHWRKRRGAKRIRH